MSLFLSQCLADKSAPTWATAISHWAFIFWDAKLSGGFCVFPTCGWRPLDHLPGTRDQGWQIMAVCAGGAWPPALLLRPLAFHWAEKQFSVQPRMTRKRLRWLRTVCRPSRITCGISPQTQCLTPACSDHRPFTPCWEVDGRDGEKWGVWVGQERNGEHFCSLSLSFSQATLSWTIDVKSHQGIPWPPPNQY